MMTHRVDFRSKLGRFSQNLTLRLKIGDFLYAASRGQNKQHVKKSLPYLELTGSYRVKCLTGSKKKSEPEVKIYII